MSRILGYMVGQNAYFGDTSPEDDDGTVNPYITALQPDTTPTPVSVPIPEAPNAYSWDTTPLIVQPPPATLTTYEALNTTLTQLPTATIVTPQNKQNKQTTQNTQNTQNTQAGLSPWLIIGLIGAGLGIVYFATKK